ADYRNEEKIICPVNKDYQHNKKSVWSLKSLNDGIKVRKEYAVKKGRSVLGSNYSAKRSILRI
ncbi:MAG: hypothetical protein ACKE51_09635, partial [Methylococcaceae bacterium]